MGKKIDVNIRNSGQVIVEKDANDKIIIKTDWKHLPIEVVETMVNNVYRMAVEETANSLTEEELKVLGQMAIDETYLEMRRAKILYQVLAVITSICLIVAVLKIKGVF